MPTLMIGIGPASGPPVPPGSKKKQGLNAGEPPIPPRSPKLQPQSQPQPTSGPGAKASPEEAIAIRADEHCRNCENYIPESGQCQKVDGQWMPDDACKRYFQAAQQQQDDEGGDEGSGADPSANDQDGDEY